MGISAPKPFASGQKAHELSLGLAEGLHQAAIFWLARLPAGRSPLKARRRGRGKRRNPINASRSRQLGARPPHKDAAEGSDRGQPGHPGGALRSLQGGSGEEPGSRSRARRPQRSGAARRAVPGAPRGAPRRGPRPLPEAAAAGPGPHLPAGPA